MNDTLHSFYEYANAEFDGNSFNGSSFMATLETLDYESASSMGTHEGYSAWSVALHVAWYKYFVASALLGGAEKGTIILGPFLHPYDADAFAEPPEASDAAWKSLLVYLRRVQDQITKALGEAGSQKMDEIMPEWEIPWARVIAWYLGHDGYHNAQIRNMGVPGLKATRLGSS